VTDKEFSQELDTHIEMATEENIRRGMSPEEARRQAMLRLGGRTALEQRHRDARGFPVLANWLLDARFALRLLKKDRWFSAAAIAAIALGIGANAFGFTMVNAAFFRGFGFDRADRLFMLSWKPEKGQRTAVSASELADWRAQQSFAELSAYTFEAFNISDDTAMPEQTQGARVTANFFAVLRQRTEIGRAFETGEDARSATPTVIIGYDIWKDRFGLDAGVLGKTLRVNGEAATIIGVMPEGMKFPDNAGSHIWIPFVPTDDQLKRTNRPLNVIGRLADAGDRQAAEAEMKAIATQMKGAYPDEMKSLAGVNIETFVERYFGGAARPMFITVMGAVIFVLLIACANVASLLLSRAIHRSREIAVRFSMGATRWAIVRQLLIESVLLSGLGGLVGLVIAIYGIDLFAAAVRASEAPYWLIFSIDYRVLAYVIGISVVTGILFGIAPALHASRANNHEVLKDGGRGMAGNKRSLGFSGALVVAELTLTVVLLCGAGLMARSFAALYALDPVIDLTQLSRMKMQLPPAKYPDVASRLRFFDQLEPRLLSIAGIDGVALTSGVPPLVGNQRWYDIDGREIREDHRDAMSTVTITPGYFDAIGVPMVRGRAFNVTDGSPGSESVIVNELFASTEFPQQDAIGKRLRFVPYDAKPGQPREAWRTIVGIAGFVPQGDPQHAFRDPVVYLPFRQEAPRTASIVIRSHQAPETVMAAVRREVQGLDRDQPVFTIEPLTHLFEIERTIYSIFATLFAVLATIAVVLSSVGLYAVMAYSVSQRTQEIGVRMALGAERSQVAWIFMRRGMRQLIIGLALGLPAALALGGLARFRLVEIEPSDPVTFIGITVMLTIVSLAACLVPVLRAAKVDPMVALRAD
jgi:predicted permease